MMKNQPTPSDTSAKLLPKLQSLGPREGAELLKPLAPSLAAEALALMLPNLAQDILAYLPEDSRKAIFAAASSDLVRQWQLDKMFPAGSVGRLMETPKGVFPPAQTVKETVEALRPVVKEHLITYGFVVDSNGALEGVITMRDLLFCDPESKLSEIMLRDIFSLKAEMTLLEAMKSTLDRHYPVYPVTDADGRLLGLIRGQAIFEAQAFELSAQAGSMVGVEKEERFSTPWQRSFLFRHPWLQLNLVTAFVAAAVVGIFENTISQVVALAVFLPVLAGQSGNTGCQALAVSLRAMTLGELDQGKAKLAVFKEGLLGLLNGAVVGVTAGLGMLAFATWQKNDNALLLGLVVFLAMLGSCVVSGICGAIIPLILKRLGADPATASSIFLTTATDVISMGLFLGLATILIL